jgi:hypothetical protein
MASSGMLRSVALVRTDDSEERSASIIKVTRICELGTTLAVTSNRRSLRRSTLPSEVHKFSHLFGIKINQWKEFVIVPIYKKSSQTECSNSCGISLLPASYNILPNILLSRLDPYILVYIFKINCNYLSYL